MGEEETEPVADLGKAADRSIRIKKGKGIRMKKHIGHKYLALFMSSAMILNTLPVFRAQAMQSDTDTSVFTDGDSFQNAQGSVDFEESVFAQSRQDSSFDAGRDAEAFSDEAFGQSAQEQNSSDENAADESRMIETWDVEDAQWQGNTLHLSFSYACDNPIFAAILPMSADARFGKDQSLVIEEDGIKLADLIIEARQFGLLFTEEGLEYLREGNAIECDVTLVFDEEKSVFAIQVGSSLVSSQDQSLMTVSDPIGSILGHEDMQKERKQSLADSFRAQAQHSARLSYGTMNERIGVLKSTFPSQSYWNHAAGDRTGNPELHTSHETDDVNYIGNEFGYYALCNGFAYLCYYKTNGVLVTNPSSTIHRVGNEGVRVGDVIHTRHKWDDPVLGHYSYVWKIEGNTYYKLEANYKGRDQIWQTNTVQKSDIVDYFTPASEGRYTVWTDENLDGGYSRYDTNATSQALIMPGVSNAPKFHQLDGWEIFNCTNYSQLFTNGKGEYRWFNSAMEASLSGFGKTAVMPQGSTLPLIFKPGDEIVLTAKWKRQPYTIAFDANGGGGTQASVTGYLGLAPELPANTGFKKTGYAFNGYTGYYSSGQKIYRTAQSNGASYRGFSSDEEARKNGYSPAHFMPGKLDGTLTDKAGERIVMKVNWVPKTYTLKFTNLYGNTVKNAPQGFKYNDRVAVPKQTLNRDGYAFIGWVVSKNGSTLCVSNKNGKQNYKMFPSINAAANQGYVPAVIPNGGAYMMSFEDSDGTEIQMEARWKNVRDKKVSMHRLYNPNSGEHFYTYSTPEKDALVKLGWKFEGTGWIAPRKSNTPVYRLYNPNAGDHHYTTDANERKGLIGLGWKDEGIGWYSDDEKSVPIFREYNRNAKTGSHNYTSSVEEHLGLMKMSWNGEGIGWYGTDKK